MAMKVKVEIDTRTFVRFWLVVFGIALLGLMIYVARSPLLIIGVSFFLAIALTPPVNKLASWLPGGSRIGGTALAYVIVVAILGGFVLLVVPPIVEQSAKFAQTVPDMVESVLDSSSGLGSIVERYGLQGQVNRAAESVKDNATEWAGNIGSSLISGVGSLVRVMISILITLVMTFFMLIEGPNWIRRLWGVYLNKELMRYHRSIATKMYKVVTSYVNGQLLVAMIAGVLAGIAMLVIAKVFELPMNLAVPVAAIIAIGSLVPMFGATVGGVISGVLIAFNDIGAALVFVVYLVIYQQIESNLITTYIQAKTLDLSPLAVLVAVTLGTFVFGLIGGLISIPVLGIIQVLTREFLDYRRGEIDTGKGPLRRVVERLQATNETTEAN